MNIKPKTIIFLICISNCLFGQQDNSPTRLGLKNFLSGDLTESVKYFSQAIKQDSLEYENFYFRGLTRAYLSDTANCITDFFKAIDLKAKHPHIQKDTVVNSWLNSKPVRNSRICAQSLDHQSDLFFQAWLGTWLMLTDENKGESCKNFKQAEQGGLRQIKTYRSKYCR
jgi:hypothetical protein